MSGWMISFMLRSSLALLNKFLFNKALRSFNLFADVALMKFQVYMGRLYSKAVVTPDNPLLGVYLSWILPLTSKSFILCKDNFLLKGYIKRVCRIGEYRMWMEVLIRRFHTIRHFFSQIEVFGSEVKLSFLKSLNVLELFFIFHNNEEN